MYKVTVDRKLNKLNAKELHKFHKDQAKKFLKEYKLNTIITG